MSISTFLVLVKVVFRRFIDTHYDPLDLSIGLVLKTITEASF